MKKTLRAAPADRAAMTAKCFRRHNERAAPGFSREMPSADLIIDATCRRHYYGCQEMSFTPLFHARELDARRRFLRRGHLLHDDDARAISREMPPCRHDDGRKSAAMI